MKSGPFAALLLSVCLPFFSAAAEEENFQKNYPVGSDLYRAISFLYIDQGLSLPSTAGPWSADELRKMLDRLDPSRFEQGATEAYHFARATLDERHGVFRFDLSSAIEAYFHMNTADFTTEGGWARGSEEREALFDLGMESWLAGLFYGYSSLTMQNSVYNSWNSAEGNSSTLWGSSALTTNVPLIPPASLNDLSCNFPYRAFASAGGSGWSFELGRDRYSWGPGESGNFVLGSHFLYHNMGRFTGYAKNFKYTLATSFFPYPGNYYPIIDPDTGAFVNQRTQDDAVSGLSMFLGHRLEWRLFGDRVGVALNEAVMYESADNTIDLSILSPTAIFHNYFERSNANSILSAEADWSPFRRLDLYGQLVVDEFALPSEAQPGLDPSARPNALGYMAGAKTAIPLGRGMLFGSAEWAKTDPYLYLRDSGDRDQELGEYGVDWVVAEREFYNPMGVAYTEKFLGYQFGCDAIVLDGRIGYRRFARWSVQANLFYMIHGTHDQWTTWGDEDDSVQDTETTPTTSHHTANNADKRANERDAASYTFSAGLRGDYALSRGFLVYGQVDYIHIRNPGNLSSRAPIWDLQVTAGIKCKL